EPARPTTGQAGSCRLSGFVVPGTPGRPAASRRTIAGRRLLPARPLRALRTLRPGRALGSGDRVGPLLDAPLALGGIRWRSRPAALPRRRLASGRRSVGRSWPARRGTVLGATGAPRRWFARGTLPAGRLTTSGRAVGLVLRRTWPAGTVRRSVLTAAFVGGERSRCRGTSDSCRARRGRTLHGLVAAPGVRRGPALAGPGLVRRGLVCCGLVGLALGRSLVSLVTALGAALVVLARKVGVALAIDAIHPERHRQRGRNGHHGEAVDQRRAHGED